MPQTRHADLNLDELVQSALAEQQRAEEDTQDEDLSYLVALHARAERPTFDRARELAAASDPAQRRLGLRILAELGPWANRTFKTDSVPFLRARLDAETDGEALAETVKALAWQGDHSTVDDILRFVEDRRVEVRSAAIHNLTQYISLPRATHPHIVRALVGATRDSESENRYSAVYDLANWISASDPEVRVALEGRLADADSLVRQLAALGLARDEAGWRVLLAGEAASTVQEVRISADPGWFAFRICGRQDDTARVAIVLVGERFSWSDLADVRLHTWQEWHHAIGLVRSGAADATFDFSTSVSNVSLTVGRHLEGVPQVTGCIDGDGKHWHETLTWCWQMSRPEDLERLHQQLAAAGERAAS